MPSVNGSTSPGRCLTSIHTYILTLYRVYEVFLGILIGSLLGFSARKIMRFSERKNFIDRQSYVAQYVSLAVLSIGTFLAAWERHLLTLKGITTLLGSDDLLAAFACGTAFAWE